MVAQAKGEEALLLAFHADQERDQQADAPTVHVLQRTEVQDNGAGTGRGCLRVGVHEHIFSHRGDLAANVHDTGALAHEPHVHRYLNLWHRLPLLLSSRLPALPHVALQVVGFASGAGAPARALVSSGNMLMKSARRVMWKIST